MTSTSVDATTAPPLARAPDNARAPRLPHIGALDGLRGLAIALVMFHHMTLLDPISPIDHVLKWMGGMAWCGVDLFFVLSGFLITGILLDTRGGPHYFRQFYARRTLRIFPLYYAMLFLYLVILPHSRWAQYIPKGDVVLPARYFWLYLSNIAMAMAGSFGISVLSITWSLAIEEQFYLVWPTVVRFVRGSALLWIALAGVVIPPVLRSVLVLHGANVIVPYVLTPCRLEPIAVGAILAMMMRSDGWALCQRAARIVVWLALGAIAVTFAVQGNPTIYGKPMQTVGYTFFALMFGALLVLSVSARPGNALFRVTNLKLLRFFGRYSYAAYLLQPMVVVFMRRSFIRPERFPAIAHSHIPAQLLFYAVGFSASMGLAVLSWHLWEKHFLRLKALFPYGRVPGDRSAK